VIIDISNPSSPVLKGSYDTAGYAYGVTISGNCAYVADGSNGLVIIDISNPSSPVLKGSYNTAGYANSVSVSGNYAYVADDYNGLVILRTNIQNQELANGSLVQLEGISDVYLIENGMKRHFTSSEALLWNGYSFDDVKTVTSETLQSYPDGEDISISQPIIDKYHALSGEPIFGASSGEGEKIGDQDSAGTYCSYVNFENGAIECFQEGDLKGKAYAIFNPLLTKWASMGYGKSVLGYPIDNMSNEETSKFGTKFRYQNFANGDERGALEYNLTSGNVFEIHGAIFAKWGVIGYANSELGLVTSDEKVADVSPQGTTGKYSEFENGCIHWISDKVDENAGHSQRGQSFVTYGDLNEMYDEMGGTGSELGFPIMDQEENDGYGYCKFEGGDIDWDDSTGTYKVNSPTTNTPPTTNPVSVTNTESLTPTISWTYYDAESDPQQQYELEVWTGSGGAGTNLWTTAQSSIYTSVTYAGASLAGGNTYYVRVKVFDGSNWGEWSETSFIPLSEEDNEPPQILFWGSPADSSTVYDSPVLVSGTVTDPSGVESVSVNGKDVTPPFSELSTSVSFSDYVFLTQGENEITIAATDDSENHNYGVIITIHVNYPYIDTTFRPNPNGWQFGNERGREYSWSDFCRVFNYNYEGSDIFVSEKFPKAYNFYQQHFKNSGNTGVCFGMSATSLELYNHGFSGWGYKKSDPMPQLWTGVGHFVEGYSPQKVENFIEYYHPFTCDAAVLDEISKYDDNDLEVVYTELKQRMASNWKQDPMVLGFKFDYSDGTSGNHMVVPYKIEESKDHKSSKIYIYDPEKPDSERYMQINREEWTASDYGEWKNLRNFRLVSLKAINEPPQIPSYIISNAYPINAHLLFTDGSGRHLGYYQGEFKEEIPETCSIVNYGQANSSQESYYIPDPSLKKELYGVNKGVSTISMYTPNGLIVADVQVSQYSVDEFKILNNGLSVEFISGSGTPSLSLMLDKETTDIAQIVRANISQIEENGAINLSNIDGTISIQNRGLPRTCNLYFEQMGISPNSDDSIKNIVIEEDSTVFIKPSNWNDISNTEVVIDHDLGSDGTVDSIEIIRQKDNTPPSTIIDLQSTSNSIWINWTWNKPSDSDFNHTEIYLNNIFQTNTSAEFFNATGLEPETEYTISTRTVDISGNVNETWVNSTVTTLAELASDTEKPVIQSVVLYPANTTTGSTINVTVTATDNIDVTGVTAGDIQLAKTDGLWQGSVTVPSSVGDYSLLITAKDATGNTAETTANYKVVTPTGSLGVGIAPKTTTAPTSGKTIDYTVKIKSIQNFDDIVRVNVTMDGLPASYQIPLDWFEWNNKTINIPSNSTVSLPLKLTIPPGQAAGRKAFKVRANSTLWITSASDSGVITIS
jgi:hypothetical protein